MDKEATKKQHQKESKKNTRGILEQQHREFTVVVSQSVETGEDDETIEEIRGP